MKNIFIYTFLRIIILGSFAATGYLVGLRGALLLLISFLASGIVSLFVLSKSRDNLSYSVHNLFKKVNNRITKSAQKEDRLIDEN